MLEASVKASLEGAQFACSQTAIDEKDPMWMNSLDINIPSITISAYNKNLFTDAPLTIAHGRHYGLVGPNGKGKSTLLKMIASGSLKIPPRIDKLYVEQEVHADETPAVEAVLMADKVRWALIVEERTLLAELASGPNEALDARLATVYEEVLTLYSTFFKKIHIKPLYFIFYPRLQQRLFLLHFDNHSFSDNPFSASLLTFSFYQ